MFSTAFMEDLNVAAWALKELSRGRVPEHARLLPASLAVNRLIAEGHLRADLDGAADVLMDAAIGYEIDIEKCNRAGLILLARTLRMRTAIHVMQHGAQSH